MVNADKAAAYGLTSRERQVLARLAEGETAKETALALGVSPRTVEIYAAAIRRKVGVSSVLRLLAKGYREGLLQ